MFDRPLSDLAEKDREIATSILKVGIPATIGVACASIRYLFEFGYCDHFEIPRRLIKIEMVDIAIATACLLAIFAFIVWAIREYWIYVFSRIHSSFFKMISPIVSPLLLVLLLLWVFSSPHLGLIFYLIVICLLTGQSAALVFHKSHQISKTKRFVQAVFFAIAFSLITLIITLQFYSAWMSAIVSLIPTLFAAAVFFLHKHFPIPNPESEIQTDEVSQGKVFTDNDSLTDTEPKQKLNEIATFVVASIVAILIMAGCTFAFGRHSAKTRLFFPQVDAYPDYIILKTYGDMNYLRRVSDTNGKKTLENEYLILTDEELAPSVRRIVAAGPFH